MPIWIREPRALLVLVGLVLVAIAGLLFPFKWMPELHRLPFTPELITGEKHPLCQDWLTLARREFLQGRSIPLAPSQYVLPLQATEEPKFIDLDVFGDGKPLRFVIASRVFNWKSDVLVFGAYRDSSRKVHSVDEVWKAASRESIIEPLDTGHLWGYPVLRVLRFRDAIYFARSAPREHLTLVGDRHSLWRVTKSGKREIVCELEVVSGGRRSQDGLVSVARLLGELGNVVGTDAGCGTLCPQHTIRVTSNSIAWRMRRQPWSFPGAGSSLHDRVVLDGNRAIDILNYWSVQGAWAYEVTLRIKELLPNARAELVKYYASEFSMPRRKAEEVADTALFSYLIAHFNLSSEIRGSKTRSLNDATRALLERESISDVANEYHEWSSGYNKSRQIWPYQEALLYGAAVDQLQKIPADLQKHLSEPELILAVRWPYLIRHIVERDGRDVLNKGNGFAKTPLMYAAHFHLHDSASTLLGFGADPNRQTTRGAFDVPVRIAGRTALMYAAENSDRRMIELLLAHGADKTLRDTDGRRALDYLPLNTRLSASERAELAGILG